MTDRTPLPISRHEILLLAVAARRDPRTVAAAYKGTARQLARDAIAAAAREHDLPEPPVAQRAA